MTATRRAAWGDHGWRSRLPAVSLHVRATLKLSLGLISIGTLAWIAHDQALTITDAYARVAAHRAVASQGQALLVGMVNQEAGLRGYQATADPALLDSYTAGRREVDEQLGLLARAPLTDGERAALSSASASAAAWEAWAEDERARVAAGGPDPSVERSAAGSHLFDVFRADDAALAAAAERAAGADAGTADERLRTDTLRIAAAAVACVSALLLLVYLAVWQVLRPVWRLARAARSLATDVETEVPFAGRRDEIGALARALVDLRYTTAEQMAMAKLAAESDARFRTVFDRAPIGIARLALGGRLLDANPTLRDMLGYEGDEMLRLSVADLLHRRDRERCLGLFQQQADRFVMEVRLLKLDGTIFWGLLTTALARMQDGRPLFYVAMVEDINERKQQESELQHQVTHDALTGLYNRRHFLASVEAALADRRQSRTAVFVLDLDGFKQVNDTLGHAAGDDLLRQVAVRMGEVMRNSDLVARLGGDEFAVLLPGTGREGADVAARKLLAALRRPFLVEGRSVQVGGSLGIALAPEHGHETAQLVERADLAMYRAKRAGGGMEIAA